MGVTLRDFMSSGDVLTIEPTVTLGEAARAMRRSERRRRHGVERGRRRWHLHRARPVARDQPASFAYCWEAMNSQSPPSFHGPAFDLPCRPMPVKSLKNWFTRSGVGATCRSRRAASPCFPAPRKTPSCA